MRHTLIFLLLLLFTPLRGQWVQTDGPSGSYGQYVFTSNGDIFVLSRTAVLHSTDEGKSWEWTYPPFLRNWVNTGNKFYISSSDALFIIHGDTLYRSKDKGVNWDHIFNDVFRNASFLVSSTGYLYLYNQYSEGNVIPYLR